MGDVLRPTPVLTLLEYLYEECSADALAKTRKTAAYMRVELSFAVYAQGPE